MSKSKKVKASNITDDQIMDLYSDRDEAAISKTDTKYGGMLYTIAYNILYDHQDCEECKDDTYLRVWNAIPPSRPTVFSAFISRIMRNIATDRYKARNSQKRIPSAMTVSIDELEELLHSANSPEAEYEAKEIARLISEYIRSLTVRQQVIFMERFYLGETIEQIAKEYGIPSAKVFRELSKIKLGLKKYLERNEIYL